MLTYWADPSGAPPSRRCPFITRFTNHGLSDLRDAALAVACTQGRHAAGEVLQKPKLRRKRGSGGPSPRQRKGERNLQRQAGEAAASAPVAVQTRERDAEYQADLQLLLAAQRVPVKREPAAPHKEVKQQMAEKVSEKETSASLSQLRRSKRGPSRGGAGASLAACICLGRMIHHR